MDRNLRMAILRHKCNTPVKYSLSGYVYVCVCVCVCRCLHVFVCVCVCVCVYLCVLAVISPIRDCPVDISLPFSYLYHQRQQHDQLQQQQLVNIGIVAFVVPVN